VSRSAGKAAYPRRAGGRGVGRNRAGGAAGSTALRAVCDARRITQIGVRVALALVGDQVAAPRLRALAVRRASHFAGTIRQVAVVAAWAGCLTAVGGQR